VIAAAAVAAFAWLVLITATPLLPAPLAGSLYLFGSVICHQLPERSFHLGIAQLPVCARCVGIYAGAAVGMALAASRASSRLFAFTGPGVRRSRAVLLAGAAPTLVTVGLEWVGVWYPSNIARAVAGAPLGIAVALVVGGAFATLHYVPCVPRRPIASPPPATRT